MSERSRDKGQRLLFFEGVASHTARKRPLKRIDVAEVEIGSICGMTMHVIAQVRHAPCRKRVSDAV